MSEQVDQNDPKDPWAWSLWRKNREWVDKLDRQIAHKALGIPDEVDIHANNSRNGLDWKGLAVLAAAGLGGFALYQNGQQTANVPTGQREPVVVDDTSYKVLFYDAEGNPISVPHISQRTE